MLKSKYKFVFTGGNGRFGQVLKIKLKKKNFIFPTKNQLNILNLNSIISFVDKHNPKYFVHMAALSRPMSIHEKDIKKSIDVNIIGTANVTKICSEKNIKLIYFSTQYVYPGKDGNYKEDDFLFPINNYGWSKLGGECSVMMYKNSLILRLSMTERPFIHKSAFYDSYSNFIFHDEIVPILFKVYKKKGILNLGGPRKSIYQFAKKYNPNIQGISVKKFKNKFPSDPSMSLNKLNQILKND